MQALVEAEWAAGGTECAKEQNCDRNLEGVKGWNRDPLSRAGGSGRVAKRRIRR